MWRVASETALPDILPLIESGAGLIGALIAWGRSRHQGTDLLDDILRGFGLGLACGAAVVFLVLLGWVSANA